MLRHHRSAFMSKYEAGMEIELLTASSVKLGNMCGSVLPAPSRPSPWPVGRGKMLSALRDGLGYVRGLMSTSKTITDRYVYDAYGNDVAPNLHNTTEGNALRFRGNGSYPDSFVTGGYRTLYLLTGQQSTSTATVMHVGARHYSPSLHRWLQRDPIQLSGGDPNLYAYCANNPVAAVDVAGRFTFFVHGSFSSPKKWTQAFMSAAKKWCGEKTGHHDLDWTGIPDATFLDLAGLQLAKKIKQVWKKYGQTEPIYIFAHSHGGNIALIASQYLSRWGYKSGNIALIAFGTPWQPFWPLISIHPSDLLERVYNVSSRFDAIQWLFGERVPGFGKDSSDCAWTNVWYDRSERVGHTDLGSTADVSKLPPFRRR